METTTQRRIIDDRWALTAAAGGGGMSRVYRAIDLEQEYGEVAVKVLPVPRQEDRWAVKAFDLEFQARAAPLQHPNIVPLLSRGRDPATGDPYLVFPWAGTPLTEILAKRGSIPWSEWWPTYGRPLLDALAHAHRQDVAHRDVKPDNVLVADDGRPVLADFGVAKLLRHAAPGLTMAEHVSRRSSGGIPIQKVRVMSAHDPDSSSRTPRSMMSGSPAWITPEPRSWGRAACAP